MERTRSLLALTASVSRSQSGSTLAAPSRPSWRSQNCHRRSQRPVLGQQGQQVVELGREGVAVVVGGEEPGRGALEHTQLGDLVDEARDELGRAGPRADDGDPLAGQVDGVVPGGRVERRGRRSPLGPRRRERGTVQLADGADEGVEGLGRGGVVAGPTG